MYKFFSGSLLISICRSHFAVEFINVIRIVSYWVITFLLSCITEFFSFFSLSAFSPCSLAKGYRSRFSRSTIVGGTDTSKERIMVFVVTIFPSLVIFIFGLDLQIFYNFSGFSTSFKIAVLIISLLELRFNGSRRDLSWRFMWAILHSDMQSVIFLNYHCLLLKVDFFPLDLGL